MKLLDLFCGAGGCAMGYHRAGFDEIVGVDIKPQKNYPFTFVQGDALEYVQRHGGNFDVIHASPPCQKYCQVNRRSHLAGKTYPDLIGPMRELLSQIGKIWVIENVENAPLQNAIRLCGSSFGLPIRRHRLFESSLLLMGQDCSHSWQERSGKRYPTCFQPRASNNSHGKRMTSTVVQIYGHTSGVGLWPKAMGIDWMNRQEMTQAIPPAYTEFIGKQLLRALQNV